MAIDRMTYEMGWLTSQTPGGKTEANRKANDVLPAATVEGQQTIGEGLMRSLLSEFGRDVFNPENGFGLIFNPETGSGIPGAILLNIQRDERNERFQDLHNQSHILAITPDGVTELFNLNLAEITELDQSQQQEFFDKLKGNIQEKKSSLPWKPLAEHFDNWSGFKTKFSKNKAYANKLVWNADIFLDVKSLLTRRKAFLNEKLVKESSQQ